MKNIIITILAILLLGLGGYLVYDKVINKEDVSIDEETQKEPTNDVEIEKKDAAYFDEYLKAFLSCDGTFVTRNTENFTDKDISNFVSRYYNLLSNGNGSYKANVSDVDALIYKYFNKKDVVLEIKPNEATTITKEVDVYSFEWNAVGCQSDRAVDPVVTYTGENVTVKYQLYADLCESEEDCGYTGKYLTFHLKYNNGNYNIIKIEE